MLSLPLAAVFLAGVAATLVTAATLAYFYSARIVDYLSVRLGDDIKRREANAVSHRRPKRIILIRHGQSEGNVQKSLYETVPDNMIELTHIGKRQAVEAGKELKKLIGDESVMFYVSPFVRSQQTYELIVRAFDDNKTRMREDPRVREQEWGNFQQPAEMLHTLKEREAVGRFYYRFPNGESGADVFDRVSSFLASFFREIGSQQIEENVVIVAHGLLIRLFLMRYYRWSVEKFHSVWNFDNCEFAIMEKQPNDSYKLVTPIRCNWKIRTRNHSVSSFSSNVPNTWRGNRYAPQLSMIGGSGKSPRKSPLVRRSSVERRRSLDKRAAALSSSTSASSSASSSKNNSPLKQRLSPNKHKVAPGLSDSGPDSGSGRGSGSGVGAAVNAFDMTTDADDADDADDDDGDDDDEVDDDDDVDEYGRHVHDLRDVDDDDDDDDDDDGDDDDDDNDDDDDDEFADSFGRANLVRPSLMNTSRAGASPTGTHKHMSSGVSVPMSQSRRTMYGGGGGGGTLRFRPNSSNARGTGVRRSSYAVPSSSAARHKHAVVGGRGPRGTIGWADKAAVAQMETHSSLLTEGEDDDTCTET